MCASSSQASNTILITEEKSLPLPAFTNGRMKQCTLKNNYSFEGRGLHTGKFAHMTLKPAQTGTGIRFVRTDLPGAPVVEALGENVSNTARSTTISQNGASVVTIEHIMSALTGLGVDNALIEIDNEEVPILDGSARYYAEAIAKDGVLAQDADREFINIPEEIEVVDEQTGSYVKISPADTLSYDLTVDFNSKVLGVQSAHWNLGMDYATEYASCRTFVFFHELEFLAKQGLVKGGDVDNAIVVVEYPTTDEQVSSLCELFGKPKLAVSSNGYLNNLELHFPDECGRHKLLDLIGDIRLAGGYLNAKITAYKSGHKINTDTVKALREALKKQK